ncbi:MAG: single-stranded DNA-binding protein [Deltaproteobacteria bacterium]|nr:single-stranded DNA-binding protein [Deltaproteobacteria bacterium]
MSLWSISHRLGEEVANLQFASPVTHVYNPLAYAADPHRQYLDRYGKGTPEVLLLGMNPGPWGMAQTGVPFGEVNAVQDWLAIDGQVGRPSQEHPKRPVTGFACARSEVSGRRVWGWAADRFKTPERFFERFFIGNYCPLIFLEESGRNRTPDRLSKTERSSLFEICDRALVDLVTHLSPKKVIGFGRFAENRALAALADAPVGAQIEIGRILHPSPASPAANAGWAEQIEKQLVDQGIRL